MELGIGDKQARLKICIGNRPPLTTFEQMTGVKPVISGEIAEIVESTSNHWRKIFNLFAKLGFELNESGESSWQAYRENQLLQARSGTALIFSKPEFANADSVHIVSGHSYAKQLGLYDDLDGQGEDFLIDPARRLIVSPYFDYRQLSNAKLKELLKLVKDLMDETAFDIRR